ncbi:MAG: hypothetical protein KGZ68_00965 [Dechloromonas sp.]|nr:hypothetical protein [Dechloromonas sp.]
MSAMNTALQRIARETQIAFEMCHEMAVQRLVDSNWLYRDTAGRALGLGVKEAWDMPHVEIRERALERAANELKRITHWSYCRSRHLACLELAEAAKRKIEREQQMEAR